MFAAVCSVFARMCSLCRPMCSGWPGAAFGLARRRRRPDRPLSSAGPLHGSLRYRMQAKLPRVHAYESRGGQESRLRTRTPRRAVRSPGPDEGAKCVRQQGFAGFDTSLRIDRVSCDVLKARCRQRRGECERTLVRRDTLAAGGQVGEARAESLSAERQLEFARQPASARWHADV